MIYFLTCAMGTVLDGTEGAVKSSGRTARIFAAWD